jgi:hypothetical protein
MTVASFELRGPLRPMRRLVTLHCEAGRSIGRVQDNVHDFSVTLLHDGVRVTDVEAQAIRFPWTTCPMGTERLKALIGTPLVGGDREKIDQSLQCTHMLDVAKLALAHASRGGDREYRVQVDAKDAAGECLAVLYRDGRILFQWHIVNRVVVAPEPFAGHVTSGRSVWSPAVEADDDLREAALVMRRGVFVFLGRGRVRPKDVRANFFADMTGACISFHPAQIDRAVRPPGFVELD